MSPLEQLQASIRLRRLRGQPRLGKVELGMLMIHPEWISSLELSTEETIQLQRAAASAEQLNTPPLRQMLPSPHEIRRTGVLELLQSAEPLKTGWTVGVMQLSAYIQRVHWIRRTPRNMIQSQRSHLPPEPVLSEHHLAGLEKLELSPELSRGLRALLCPCQMEAELLRQPQTAEDWNLHAALRSNLDPSLITPDRLGLYLAWPHPDWPHPDSPHTQALTPAPSQGPWNWNRWLGNHTPSPSLPGKHLQRPERGLGPPHARSLELARHRKITRTLALELANLSVPREASAHPGPAALLAMAIHLSPESRRALLSPHPELRRQLWETMASLGSPQGQSLLLNPRLRSSPRTLIAWWELRRDLTIMKRVGPT